MYATVVATVTAVIVLIGICRGVYLLTGNLDAGTALGFATGFFVYQVVFTLCTIAESLKKKSE